MQVLEGLFTILQLVGTVLFVYQGWIILAAILGYLIWQNRRREVWVSHTDHILLRIDIPKENEKKELSAEQMFASLHGILRPKSELTKEGIVQEHISFEIASINNQIQFYVWVPRHLKDFVEGQIYAQYPTVHITEGAEDYTSDAINDRFIYGTELVFNKDEMLPIKTFPSFEVDPLAGITAVMSKLEVKGEEMWIQILARPIDDSWHEKGLKFIESIKNGKSIGWGQSLARIALDLVAHLLGNFVPGMMVGPAEKKEEKKKDDDKKLSTGQQTLTKAVEEKITKLGYKVKIRIGYMGPDQLTARLRVQAIVGAFKQFNTTNLNGFTTGKYFDGEDFLEDYKARLFLGGGQILNIEELASLYHLPHKSVETPNLVWTTIKTGEPPANLPTENNTKPEEVSLFGQTNFRGHKQKFGIKRLDRGRHLYVIGQTGVGKSQLMQLLTLSDIYHGHGMAIIDPHGDLASDVMKFIPEHRLKDVIYFNPADIDFPMAFNPLEVIDENSKNHLSSELIGVLKRMFESWGPRLEYILRFTILALLDYPDSTMLGITRMLTEKDFRKKVVKMIKDPVVKNFWVNEFASWNDKFANEAVAPVLNKVGAFTANPLVRNVIGQPKSTMDIRQIMDEGKILIVNLSRGQVGEDNAAILGALMVTKIQLAAMSRADVPMDQRRPFYLYVDEFQNFATDSFAVILSEARKYGLNLTVANQYISQMPETVREAVFGNVGSMVTFRIGAGDASFLTKYFEPVFEATDLVKMHNRHIFISMSIDGEKSLPFSATTLAMPETQQDLSVEIIEQSRHKYARTKAEVEDEITRWTNTALTDLSGDGEAAEPAADNSAEQKPNSFLGALKNPEAPAQQSKHDGAGRQEHRPQHGHQPKHHDKPYRPQEQKPNVNEASQPSTHSQELQAGEVVELHR
jgi:hypothetical protein